MAVRAWPRRPAGVGHQVGGRTDGGSGGQRTVTENERRRRGSVAMW